MPPTHNTTAARRRRKRQRDLKRERFERAYGSIEYVQAVTSHPCVIAARNGSGPVHDACVYMEHRSEACHVVKKTRDDELATWRGLWPGCTQHHGEGEGKDPSYYLETYKVNVVREAELMVAAYSHLVPEAA